MPKHMVKGSGKRFAKELSQKKKKEKKKDSDTDKWLILNAYSFNTSSWLYKG